MFNAQRSQSVQLSQCERQTETRRQRDRDREREKEDRDIETRQTGRQTDGQRGRLQAGRQADRQKQFCLETYR